MFSCFEFSSCNDVIPHRFPKTKLYHFQNEYSFGIFLCEVCQPYRLRMRILLAFFSAKSANPTVFRMRILLAFFSAKSANPTV